MRTKIYDKIAQIKEYRNVSNMMFLQDTQNSLNFLKVAGDKL